MSSNQELFNTPDLRSISDNQLVKGAVLKQVIKDLAQVANNNTSVFDPVSGEILINSRYRYYGEISQTKFITFNVNTSNMMLGGCSVIRVIANGSGVAFTGIKETSGSSGFDRTNGVVNIIAFLYDGKEVLYTVQQTVQTTPDTTAPILSSVIIPNGGSTTVEITYDEELDLNCADVNCFHLRDNSGPTIAISSAVVNGNVVTLTTSTTLSSSSTYYLDYVGANSTSNPKTKIIDIYGNEAIDYTNQAVSNQLAIYNPSTYNTYVKSTWITGRSLDGIVSNGGNVTSLVNSGSKGGNYTPVGNAPTFVANQLNSTGIIRFVQASNQYLRGASTHTKPNVYTKFIVVKSVAGSNGTIENHYSLNDATIFGATTNKYTNYSGISRSTEPPTITGSTFGDAWVIMTLKAGASSFVRRINGAVELTFAQTVTPANSAANYHTIGFNGINSPASMDLAEIITVEGEMTNADIEKFEGYLAWTLGLQSSLDASHPYKNSPPGA